MRAGGGAIDNHGRNPNAVERGNLTGNRIHEMRGKNGRGGILDGKDEMVNIGILAYGQKLLKEGLEKAAKNRAKGWDVEERDEWGEIKTEDEKDGEWPGKSG